MKVPDWIIDGIKDRNRSKGLLDILKKKKIVTICKEAQCPNIGTCFERGTATFLIMGPNCSRNCSFCAVTSKKPEPLDSEEPRRIAEMVKSLGIRHVVITSVSRDDLDDGGSGHFVETIRAVKGMNQGVTVEVLIPDFGGDSLSLKKIIDEKPEVINHNVETVEELYNEVRPGAVYTRSLKLLSEVSRKSNGVVTKSGMMVGLGESAEQVFKTMDDLVEAGVKAFTIGQYLRPTTEHHEVKRYIPPKEFERYKEVAMEKGFTAVASGPFVRSSYQAESLYEKVKEEARERIGVSE
jgi:lipoic acid synthetase